MTRKSGMSHEKVVLNQIRMNGYNIVLHIKKPTTCPESLDPIYIAAYHMKWAAIIN